jgi:coiled-coil domain-containing protein 102A
LILILQVRNERNKAREETKILRSKLEAALKDTNSYKRDKLELESVNNKLRDEMERMQQLILRDWEGPERDLKASETSNSDLFFLLRRRDCADDSELDSTAATSDQQEKELCVEEYVLQGAVPKHAIERFSSASKENAVDEEEEGGGEAEDDSASKGVDESEQHSQSEELRPEQMGDMEYLHQKLSMLQLRLEESQKIIYSERE